MAITFVAGSSIAAVAANPPTVNLTLPTLSADDIIVINVCSKNIVEASNEINTPTGYTELGSKVEIDSAAAGDDMRSAVFWKRAVAGDSGASVTISRAGTDTVLLMGVAYVFRGCTTSGDPFDTAGLASKTESVTADDIVVFPAFDPVATDVHVCYMFAGTNDYTGTQPASFTNDGTTFTQRHIVETITGSDGQMGLYSGDRNGNPLAEVSVDMGLSTTHMDIAYAFALLPPAAGGGAVLSPYYSSYYSKVVLG